jgi:hypothetical protein
MNILSTFVLIIRTLGILLNNKRISFKSEMQLACRYAIARNTAIHVVRYSRKIVISEAQNEILKNSRRFFDQAYTRFS